MAMHSGPDTDRETGLRIHRTVVLDRFGGAEAGVRTQWFSGCR